MPTEEDFQVIPILYYSIAAVLIIFGLGVIIYSLFEWKQNRRNKQESRRPEKEVTIPHVGVLGGTGIYSLTEGASFTGSAELKYKTIKNN
jgi:hypothetical protein